MNQEYIKAKLHNLPEEPGSYQMKDASGEIIYVGKAKNLHSRVNQYFTGAHDYKTTKMVAEIEDFDFIVTKSEKEALVLEINLIKKYRPKYNIMFIDDSTYPYLKITKEDYPRLLVTRDTKKDRKAKYFGPFPDASAARNTQKLLQSLYPLRRCTQMHNKVCLYYHMGQCLGPCEYDVPKETYQEIIAKITKFLNGDTKEITEDLKRKMLEASEALDFERAQEYKEMLDSIERVIDKQMIEMQNQGSLDAFVYYHEKGYISIQGFLVRRGVVLTKEYQLMPLYGNAEEEFLLFLLQYYETHPHANELVLPNDIETNDLEELLEMKIVQPQKGYRKKLLDMCMENAKKQLNLQFDITQSREELTENAVKELSKCAGRPMHRVELFDNSHTSGQFTVAACVVYIDGLPSKKDYRLYKLHTANSDIDSMKEVVYRRYFRLLKEGRSFPDAILVDGGKIQIDAAKEILDSLGISIKLMGLVKDDNHNTNALMDEDGTTFDIPHDSELFFLLTRMQDEVHRVAISYHRKLRAKAQTKSILDEIEGIGPKRKKMLLKHFKNFTNLKQASVQDIEEVLPSEVANHVYEALHMNE